MKASNQDRFRELLKTLEVSIVRKSDLNEELRYEAEFFQKRFLAEESALSRWGTIRVSEFADVADGPHGYHVVDESSPIVMLTAKNAKEWFADLDNAEHIARSVDEANKRSSLVAGDIILSTRGTLGRCALVTPDVLPANIDQDVARISWKKKSKYNVLPEFVVAYLNSRYGQDHITRQASGMVQQGLPLQKVRCIPIPLLPEAVQRSVVDVVQAALTHRRSAEAKLVDAEKALLGALGLVNWQPPEPLTYERRASEASAARRLDAGYFAPRVTEILSHLRSNGRTVGAVAPVRHEQFVPGMTGDFHYIEIGGVQSDGTAVAERVSQRAAPSRAKWCVRKGDIITSTVRPIRRLSAIISPEQDGFVCSSGFVALKPTAVSSEVLLTFLRLVTVCELMDLHTRASMYPAIAERDLLQLPFPHITSATEKLIMQLVRLAHSARRESRSLLGRAKQAVEIAIDQGDAAAMAFIENDGE